MSSFFTSLFARSTAPTPAAASASAQPTPPPATASEAEKKSMHEGRTYEDINKDPAANNKVVRNQKVIDQIKQISKEKLIGFGAAIVSCATAAILFKVSIAVVAGVTLLTMATALFVLVRQNHISAASSAEAPASPSSAAASSEEAPPSSSAAASSAEAPAKK